jgi:hypothetical protein
MAFHQQQQEQYWLLNQGPVHQSLVNGFNSSIPQSNVTQAPVTQSQAPVTPQIPAAQGKKKGTFIFLMTRS